MSRCKPTAEIVDSLNAVIWEADPVTFQFTFVSRGAEALIGYSLEHWLSQPTFWIDLLHPEDRERAVSLCRAAVADCRDHDFEYRVITATGDVRWIRDIVSVRCDDGGRAVELRGLMVDVNEHKAAEEALRADLARAQTLETLGRLTGTVAHDLNNVLCAVRGNVDLAIDLEGVRRIQPELLEIRHAAELGELLVQQLLSLGRPEPALHNIINVKESLTPMLGILQGLVGKCVHIDLDLTEAPTRVRMARGLLEQVVMNLAVNASEAMPKGGRLRIRTAIVRRTAKAIGLEAEPFLELEVSDTGSGIPDEIRPKIFDPFFTTKGASKGTGLGLAIVTAIVQDAGGEIAVESELGRGTSFRVYLPLWDPNSVLDPRD